MQKMTKCQKYKIQLINEKNEKHQNYKIRKT